MGTIVAVKKNSSVAIAADCCNVRDSTMRTSLNVSHGCILQFGDSFIGLNSSVGFQQAFEEILEDWNKAQAPALNNRQEVRRFFSRIHEELKRRNGMYVNFQQGQEFEWTPMNALVANSTGIYKIDSVRGVYQLTKFWAIGTGEPYALGAMSAAYSTLESAEEIAAAGLAAVQEFEVDLERRPEIFTRKLPKTLLSVTSRIEAGKESKSKGVTRIGRIPHPRNRSR